MSFRRLLRELRKRDEVEQSDREAQREALIAQWFKEKNAAGLLRPNAWVSEVTSERVQDGKAR